MGPTISTASLQLSESILRNNSPAVSLGARSAGRLLAATLTVALFSVTSCKRQDASQTAAAPSPTASIETPGPQSAGQSGGQSNTASQTAAASPKAGPAELWKDFSGDRAWEDVKAQIDIGPRPSGTPENEKTRKLIIDSLKKAGWTTEEQAFTDPETPHGKITFVNVIARFGANGQPPSSAAQQAIVCSHFDTKFFSSIKFVGASDGASSTGALLELARVLAEEPALASKIELVFFDGEEAIQQFTEKDGLWGSRHYARDLFDSGRAKQFQFAILWDMIGDKDLTITLPPNSPKDLATGIFEAADALNVRKNFGFYNHDILDDHVPLQRARIQAIDLIDFDYLYWHTRDDTLDKLSPNSLQTVGAVTTYFLKKKLQ